MREKKMTRPTESPNQNNNVTERAIPIFMIDDKDKEKKLKNTATEIHANKRTNSLCRMLI